MEKLALILFRLVYIVEKDKVPKLFLWSLILILIQDKTKKIKWKFRWISLINRETNCPQNHTRKLNQAVFRTTIITPELVWLQKHREGSMNVDQFAILGITQTQRQEPQDHLIRGRKIVPQANKGMHDMFISNTVLNGDKLRSLSRTRQWYPLSLFNTVSGAIEQ